MGESKHQWNAPRDGPDPLPGTVVNGKFRIVEAVASGGMGKIYRAEQLPLGRPAAVKVLHARYTESDDDAEFQKRFFLEASILSRLQHPNIVTVFDYGRIEGLVGDAFFMAMEFLPGETLRARLKRLRTLPPEMLVPIMRQIAKGLREAHRHDVVHRDLKPSNVMLVPDESGEETVKIVDFGLVKVLRDESEELTKDGSFLGSPRYMSPEQIAHGRIDLRADIYSLGVILYQCLCGVTPFEGENSVHILMAHLHSPVPPVGERDPSVRVPRSLGQLAMRCLEKDPAARPASMDDFLLALRGCEVEMGLDSGAGISTERSIPGVSRELLTDPAAVRAVLAHDADATRAVRSSGARRVALADAAPAATTEPPSSAERSPLVPALIALGVLLIVAAAWIATHRTEAPPATTEPSVPTVRAHGLEEYRLEVVSSPPGAVVSERGTVLGVAPLSVLVRNAAPARTLELSMPGYDTATLLTHPSERPEAREEVVLHGARIAPSVEVLRPTPAPTSPAVDNRVRRPAHPVAAPPSADPDIRMHR